MAAKSRGSIERPKSLDTSDLGFAVVFGTHQTPFGVSTSGNVPSRSTICGPLRRLRVKRRRVVLCDCPLAIRLEVVCAAVETSPEKGKTICNCRLPDRPGHSPRMPVPGSLATGTKPVQDATCSVDGENLRETTSSRVLADRDSLPG